MCPLIKMKSKYWRDKYPHYRACRILPFSLIGLQIWVNIKKFFRKLIQNVYKMKEWHLLYIKIIFFAILRKSWINCQTWEFLNFYFNITNYYFCVLFSGIRWPFIIYANHWILVHTGNGRRCSCSKKSALSLNKEKRFYIIRYINMYVCNSDSWLYQWTNILMCIECIKAIRCYKYWIFFFFKYLKYSLC